MRQATRRMDHGFWAKKTFAWKLLKSTEWANQKRPKAELLGLQDDEPAPGVVLRLAEVSGCDLDTCCAALMTCWGAQGLSPVTDEKQVENIVPSQVPKKKLIFNFRCFWLAQIYGFQARTTSTKRWRSYAEVPKRPRPVLFEMDLWTMPSGYPTRTSNHIQESNIMLKQTQDNTSYKLRNYDPWATRTCTITCTVFHIIIQPSRSVRCVVQSRLEVGIPFQPGRVNPLLTPDLAQVKSVFCGNKLLHVGCT